MIRRSESERDRSGSAAPAPHGAARGIRAAGRRTERGARRDGSSGSARGTPGPGPPATPVMTRPARSLRPLLLGALALAGCTPQRPPSPAPAAAPPAAAAAAPGTAAAEIAAAPAMPREFRGVWVATVANIDWPSRPGLPVEAQKAELLAHPRPRRGARSSTPSSSRSAPPPTPSTPPSWSPGRSTSPARWGRRPSPSTTRWSFAVAEAHRRGLELHAWFNPYRARHPSARSSIRRGHVSRAHPELVRVYGRYLWMDPGEPAVQDHSVRGRPRRGAPLRRRRRPHRRLLLSLPGARRAGRRRSTSPTAPATPATAPPAATLAPDDWRRQNVDRFVRAALPRDQAREAVGEVRDQPVRHLAPGPPARRSGASTRTRSSTPTRASGCATGGWTTSTPQLYWPIARGRAQLPRAAALVGASRTCTGATSGRATTPAASARTPRGWPADEIVGQIYVTRAHAGRRAATCTSARGASCRTPDSLAERLLESSAVRAAPRSCPPRRGWTPGRPRPAARLAARPARTAPGR